MKSKTKKSKKSNNYWFWVGVASVFLAAPNMMFIRIGVQDADPYVFSALRYMLISLITLPFLAKSLLIINKKQLKHALLGGIFMAISVVAIALSIKLSQASYVAVITLLEPIILVILSAKFAGDKVTPRAIAGITLAVVGAMAIVLLPIAIKQSGGLIFYPVATAIALIQCVSFPIAIIHYRKANEAGLSFMSLMGISAWITVAVSIAGYLLFGDSSTPTMANQNLWVILYAGICVALVGRILNIASYERIGATVLGTLTYLQIFLSILLPVLILHERISFAMVVGGMLILLGVYVAEHHKSIHHKHHRTFTHK